MSSPEHKLVEDFSAEMLRVLLLPENLRKARWYDNSKEDLFMRAVEELGELSEAIANGSSDEIRKEAADVANFMAMIADNAI